MSSRAALSPPLRPPLVYAHRGGSALRPENTIAAFDNGVSLGADGLEFDVHLSRDGVVVVHHDPTLERTTSGKGPIADCTADELGRLDAGFWFRPGDADAVPQRTGELPPDVFPHRGRGTRIPTLREVLGRYPGVHLIIELKVNSTALARRAIEEIRGAGAVDRVVLGSFYRNVLHAARACEPAIRTGAAREETRWALYRSWIGWPIRRTVYNEFQVPERSGSTTIVSPRFIAHAHRAGLPVKVWTVNDPADMRRLLSWGVDALISDRPDLAIEVARTRLT